MLEAKGLSKTYGTTTALDALDLSVDPGEIVCLLGANGAGKTTTINLFLAFIEPTSGSAYVDGRNVHEAPTDTKKSLAYIPEQVALYPALSGLENLRFFSELSGHRFRSPAPLYEFLEKTGIDRHTADRRVSSYSKGMRQKIGIAAALAKEATSFLLDEPLSGLDPKAANEFVGVLRDLKDKGAAVLMATHDIFRSREAATRIGIMKSGQLVQELVPESVHQNELEAIYLQHMHDGSARTEVAQ